MSQFYDVPKNTRVSRCKAASCRAPIYWTAQPRADGKPGSRTVPVDCSVLGGSEPDSFSDGRGVHHQSVCPAAGDFSE